MDTWALLEAIPSAGAPSLADWLTLALRTKSSRTTEKLGCPCVTLATRDDERAVPIIFYRINSCTLFNQQPCNVDVIQLGGNEECSRTVVPAMVDVCATLYLKLNDDQLVVLARNIQQARENVALGTILGRSTWFVPGW